MAGGYHHGFVALHQGNPVAGPLQGVHFVNAVIQIEIKLPLPVQIEKFLQFPLQNLIGFVIGNIYQFLNGIPPAVVGIELDAHLSLMPSPVHIPVYGKLHIVALVHIQDLQIEPAVHLADIPLYPIVLGLVLIKRKKQRQSVGGHIVTAKSSGRFKDHNIAVLTLQQSRVLPHNSQHNLVAAINIPLHSGNLVHGPLKFQQIYPLRGIADSVQFFHQVAVLVPAAACGHQVMKFHGSCLCGQFHQIHGRLGQAPHVQISPGNLLKAAVNIHLVKSSIVPLRTALQILDQVPGGLLIKSLLVKVPHILQFFISPGIVTPYGPGVIPDFPTAVIGEHQRQRILLVLLNQILQGCLHPYGTPGRKLRDLGILYEATAVPAAHLHADSRQVDPIGVNPKYQFPVRPQFRDSPPLIGGVHRLSIPMQFIINNVPLLQGDNGKTGRR